MFLLMLLLVGLRGLLASGPGSQNPFLQIIVPEKIQENTSDNLELENQRMFLAHNFMVYVYNQGFMNSHPSDVQAQCYYQGYVEGYPNSVVTLSTCTGLRGILQFENVSYGIEPLESVVEFQHLIYKLRDGNNEFAALTKDNQGIEQNPVDYNIIISEKSQSTVPDLIPLYLEMHIVVDKALDKCPGVQLLDHMYDYLGSESMIVTNKIIEIIGLVNAIYRNYPDYVGAAVPGKMCVTHFSAGIAMYPKEVTLEAFSIIVTQMLGLSLGISYDDTKKCHCTGAICIMNPEAIPVSLNYGSLIEEEKIPFSSMDYIEGNMERSSGVKTFSSCSLSDFENFISNMGAKCLQNKPQMQTALRAICGNGKVERGEVCDCGTEEQCGKSSCCNFRTCTLKSGARCGHGLCCKNCQIERQGVECRKARHHECDIAEFCNGSSPECQPDMTIHNGHVCKQKYVCYDGVCQDTDARCEVTFGKGSKNAPFACYEEIQSHADRFGNCGKIRGKFQSCSWRGYEILENLQCGRLICTYPTRIPFRKENGAVIYAFVRNNLCITIDYRLPNANQDPMKVSNGSHCDEGRICVNGECVESRIIKSESSVCSKKCNGHGRIVAGSMAGVAKDESANKLQLSYRPPFCETRGREASSLPEKQGLIMERAFRKAEKNRWLLGFYIALPILIIATIIAIVSWKSSKKWFTKEEESLSSE
ncbi:disintegrin and metalloproteinase domain-containing protein 32 isoform X2 [Prionailurus iriomotensis]